MTANAGESTISLLLPVQWLVGDEIIIASTGLRHSQGENEKKTITSVSGDKMTLTLDTALDYRHLGEEITITNERSLQARAEVGLLSRNVLIRGSDNPQWHDVIEACEAGFNTGKSDGCVCACLCVCECTYVYVCVCMCVCLCIVCVCVRVYVCLCACGGYLQCLTHTHTHTHTGRERERDGRPTGRLIGRSVGQLVGWSVDRLVGGSVGGSAG